MNKGHNQAGGIAGEQLRSIIDRIERLNDEKAVLTSEISDVYAEAKGNGFDVKAIRKIIALRKKDANERDEEQAILELYMRSLGMLAGTPLGEAAMERAAGAGRD